MSREIKFRQYVWDDDSKQIGSMFSWEDLLSEEGESLTCVFKETFSNASPLMQYTGLKDKNGKEIYEGDVVTWGNKKAIVVWDDNTCGFKLLYKNEKYNLWANCEVIGNVYEGEAK